MSNNITLNSNVTSGSILASDDVSGVHYQRIKLVDGTEGSTADIPGDASNGLLVNLGSNNDITITGVVTVDSELPPVATLADNTTNPSTTSVGTFPHWYDGAAWDRARGTSADGLVVDLGANNDVTISGGFLTVDGEVSLSELTTADLDTGVGTDPRAVMGIVGSASGGGQLIPGSATDGLLVNLGSNNDVTVTGTIAQSGTWTVQPGNTANTTAWKVDGSAVIQPISGTLTAAQATASSLNAQVVGTVAHDGAAGGNPLFIAGYGSDAAPTATSADGDVTRFWVNKRGATKMVLVDDSGDSVMDGTNNAVNVNVVAGGSGDGALLDGVSSSIKATILDYTNSNPLAVRLTDTAGDYVGAGAGTQYTEDAVSAANPVGSQLIARRRDALAGETTTDGDVIAVNSTDKGELYVKHVDSIPVTDNGGSLTVDNATLAVSGGGLESSALRVTIATDSTGVLSVDDNGGNLSIDDGGNSITVDGTVGISGTVTVAAHAVTQSGTWTVQPGDTPNTIPWLASIHDGQTKARVSDLYGTTALNVAIFDADGNQVSTFGSSGGSSGDSAILDGANATIKATVLDYTNSNPLAVRLTDANGDNLTAVPVTDNSGSLTVDNGGTFAVQDTTAQASLSVIDDWDESDRAKVNPIVGQAGVQGGSGAVSALTQRVVLATDVALPTGSNSIGNIGTVSTVSTVTNVVHVDDNASSLTVDGTVATTQSGTWTVQLGNTPNTTPVLMSIHDGTTKATVTDLYGSAALNVAVVNGDGTQVSNFGDGTQYNNESQLSGRVNLADTNASDVIAAQSGYKIAVLSVLVTNSDASVSTLVEIRDNTTIKLQGYGTSVGGGFSHNGGGKPLFIGSSNAAITARCATTSAEADVFISAYRIPG